MISVDSVKGKLAELRNFKQMFYSLVKKSLYGKYKNSALGFLWNFITPAISILLFYIVFENFMGRDIPNYWAYLCIGMFPFTFMNTNLIGGASCITSNGGMIKKMYFPREIIPLSQVAYTFIVFAIAYCIVAVLMIVTQYPISVNGLPALIIVIPAMFVFSLGTILITSSISVYSRDFEFFITAMARILFWITPVFYVADSLTGVLSKIIWFNPLTYFVNGFQKILYWGVMPSAEMLIICCLVSVITFIVGIFVFEKLKDGFAERI
jgi:lipopolysaccharide transport system permease protein